MSFKQCLAVAVDGGEISAADAKRLQQEFDRFRRLKAKGSDATADFEAKKALAELIAAETAHEKRKAVLSLAGIRRVANDLDRYRDASGNKDFAGAGLALLEHHDEAPFSSVAGRGRAILGRAHARMEALLYNFRRGAVGGDLTRHNRAQLPNVLRELFGENSGDKLAKELAEVWSSTGEWLRQRFNAAGGAIGKLEKWGLPQRHDPNALRKTGLNAWRVAIKPRLDVGRMTHPLSGQAVAPDELDDVLAEIWETVTTEGWNTREPKRQPFGKGAIANQRAEHRFLIFKSADDWLEYARDFGGGGDIYAAMMGHISMMSRDIAAMEILGPNPAGTIDWIKQAIQKEAQLKAAGQGGRIGGKGDPLSRANRYADRIDAVWGSIRGSLDTPAGNNWIAESLADLRNVVVSSVLGGASLSAISDTGTSQIARSFSGIGGNAFADIVKGFMPATRRESVAAGLILDSALHSFHAQARYVGTLMGRGWSRYLSDRVLTWSGLTPWTQSARHAFGLAFQHEAANQAGKAFADLHPAFRATFERWGITSAEWNKIRGAARHQMQGGTEILRPREIAGVDDALADRYAEMIHMLTEFAVPTGTHRSRTILLDQNQPGTVPGEVLRSMAMFKSFGAVFALLHGGRTHRLLMGRETKMTAAAYAGSLLISTAFFGAISIQLKQMAAGRDPRAMDDQAFWGAAMLQGGGLGIYGDFFFSDLNRYGGGLASTIGGPVAERVGDFTNLTIGNGIQLATGDETRFGRELVNFLRGNVPGGNIFYARLAWERGVLDQLQWLLDPEANRAFRDKANYWRREFGQEFFWAPGQAAPSRGPDLGRAFAVDDAPPAPAWSLP